MIHIKLDNSWKPRIIEVIAIRAVYSVGFGRKAPMYQARTIDGEWFIFSKCHNPEVKIKIARPALDQMRNTYSEGRSGAAWTSEEVAV